jgi:hypothetical protein
MTREQKLKANENYFSSVLNMLPENGVYCFKAEAAIFKKKNGKLTSSPENIDKVQGLVTPEFLKEYFSAE